MMHESKGQCIGKAPTPTSFSHYRWTASMRAAAESAPIHAVINAMHKCLSFTH